MRRDGRWEGGYGGCGFSALPKSGFMRFSRGTDLNKRPGYWAQTLPVFWCATAWAVYRRFLHAMHQSCLAHLLRRCREMILLARKLEAEFPRQIQAPVAASSATARPSSARTDQRPRCSRSPRTTGSQARSELATLLSFIPEPASR
jgi:hypothetical protein